MRLFVAVGLGDQAREKIASLQDRLKQEMPELAWVKPENLHITLKFIGERDDPGRVATALTKVVFQPFEIKVGGLGAFPNQRNPRVIWLGAESGPLSALAKQVDQALAEIGIPADEHPFHGHVTLARVKRGWKGWDGWGDFQESVAKMPVDSFDLVDSHLGPSGSRYLTACKIMAVDI
ncbi:MAG: RNA 2',3'-cyclic phosphodiesterase [Armatimonadetes bacterium]|nr:RNA 2',3'-cyclic phosphodiesterase [Armatimonadota bacterium]